jgi:LacI family transcriptional regulator
MNVTQTRQVLALSTPGDMQQVVLHGVGAWMQRHRPDWRVRLCICEPAAMARELRAWRGDGALVAEQASWRGDWLHRLSFPAINTLGLVEDPRLPSVLGDDHAIGATLAEHLLERGFRHICWVGSSRRGGFLRRRAAGVANTARAAGARFTSWQELPSLLPQLLQPIGFACANDQTGRQLIQALEGAGARVPEAAAVVGINNDPLLCSLDRIGLSSCDINLPRRGWEAAALLDRLMQGDHPPAQALRIPPRGVITRASSEALAGADEVLARAWSWLRQHADEAVHIPAVVRASGASRRSLERRVRERFGFGLQEAIWRAHVDRAKGLLQESDQDLLGIALDSGFSSASAFATIFKRFTGLSPREWRRRWRARPETDTIGL